MIKINFNELPGAAENATEITEICQDLRASLERLEEVCKRFNLPCEITVQIGQPEKLPLDLLVGLKSGEEIDV